MKYKYLGPTEFVTVGNGDIQLTAGKEYTPGELGGLFAGLEAKGMLKPADARSLNSPLGGLGGASVGGQSRRVATATDGRRENAPRMARNTARMDAGAAGTPHKKDNGGI